MRIVIAAEPIGELQGFFSRSQALGPPFDPSCLQDAPEPDQDRLGGVVPQRLSPMTAVIPRDDTRCPIGTFIFLVIQNIVL